MKTCLYFTYLHDCETNRYANLAADGVSRYLIQELEIFFDKVYVVNLEKVQKTFSVQRESKFFLSDKTIVINPSVLKFSRVEDKILWKTKLRSTIKKYLKKYAEPGGFVFAYHSLASTKILSRFKSKFKYNFIIQIEEVYSEIYSKFKRQKVSELESLAKGDGFLVANAQLKAEFNKPDQECPILLGDMRMPKSLSSKIDDGQIHLIYGGTLSGEKISLDQLILPISKLPDKFVLHIYPSNNKDELVRYLSKLAVKIQKKIYIEEPLVGEEYFVAISKYNIGLAINIDSPKLSSSAIPSKIINYLKCELKVVSTPLECVKRSDYADIIFVSKDFTANEITNAIKKCAQIDIKSEKILEVLSRKFVRDLKKLIHQVENKR